MGRHSRSNNQSTDVQSNSLFETYYKGQGIIPESEWDEFMASLRCSLPVTFRITGFRNQRKHLLNFIKEKFVKEISEICPDELNQETISFEPLPWYPNEMAWKLNTSRQSIRKLKPLQSLKEFLVSETESGNISRLETVSMLPPLVMNIKSHHIIFDMCAAPGSKSAQIVELLHSDAEDSAGCQSDHLDSNSYVEPSGVLIANDVEQRRCYMMIHQVRRLQSPCVIITQEDATRYPRLYINESQLLFDRILADVPCSGDGTLRKNPDIWSRWNPNSGMGLFSTQTTILRRGLEMLRDPTEFDEARDDYPRLVYSTCSFNPIENEAVVASMLNLCQGSIRLIQSDLLKSNDANGFKTRPGLTKWRIMTKNGIWFDNFDQVPKNLQNNINPSMFPPSNSSDLNLEFCSRIVPHDQDTGGFFIAVFEKISRLPWLKKQSNQNRNSDLVRDESKKAFSGPAKKKVCLFKENPFNYLDPSTSPIWKQLSDYYKFSINSNSNFQPCNLLARNKPDEDRSRYIYYTNSMVRNILMSNGSEKVKFINSGVRMFAVMDDKQYQGYRVTQEGVELSDAFFSKTSSRRICLDCPKDLELLLGHEAPLLDQFSERIQTICKNLPIGPIFIDYTLNSIDQDGSPTSPGCRFLLTGWRGMMSLRHYVDRHERLHMMRLANMNPKPPIPI